MTCCWKWTGWREAINSTVLPPPPPPQIAPPTPSHPSPQLCQEAAGKKGGGRGGSLWKWGWWGGGGETDPAADPAHMGAQRSMTSLFHSRPTPFLFSRPLIVRKRIVAYQAGIFNTYHFDSPCILLSSCFFSAGFMTDRNKSQLPCICNACNFGGLI